jgi:hypothetical protein
LQHFNGLAELVITHEIYEPPIVLSLNYEFTMNRHLKKLTIDGQFTFQDNAFTNFIKMIPNLESLKLMCGTISLTDFLAVIKLLKSLKVLELGRQTSLPSMPKMLDAIESHKSLEEVKMFHRGIPNGRKSKHFKFGRKTSCHMIRIK